MSETLPIGKGDALVLVDVQNDFLPGGNLAVPQGDEVIAPLNRMIARFVAAGLPVYATRDWHPADHCSFRDQGGPWPPHCVAGTQGAAFASGLDIPCSVTVVSKATTPEAEAYSGFQGTGLGQQLRDAGVRRVFVGGLATDYCVLATAQDARREGLAVVVLTDAVRAVDVQPGDGEKALVEMAGGGVQFARTDTP